MIHRLLIVLAHGKAKETCIRHLPIWNAASDLTIFCAPEDDPLHLPGHLCLNYGKSAQYSEETNRRTIFAMEQACNMRPEFLIFCEYDALLWYWPTELIARTVKDFEPTVLASQFVSADPAFRGKAYLHSPIIFTRDAVPLVLKAMNRLPMNAERGFGDRFFGLAVEEAGIKVVNGHDHGASYSQNHITGAFVDQCADAVKGGACFTHGVKEESVLTRILTRANFAY